MKTLIILNEPAYGNERSYNGLRLGLSLAKSGETELRVFLMGDAVTVALRGQTTPDGYYNLERMLRKIHGVAIYRFLGGIKGLFFPKKEADAGGEERG